MISVKSDENGVSGGESSHFSGLSINFDGVPAPDDKLMDAVIADPHNEASYWVDFHVLDPTSPSNRHIQRGSQADSQARSSMQHSNRGAYKTKATTYHREASHHDAILVPFLTQCAVLRV